MNISTSDCSSGCESGWTTYLDHSSYSADQFHRGDYTSKRANVGVQHNIDEDEDLSMVSDASSGPRQLNEEDDESYNDRGYFGYASSASEQRKASKQKKKIKEHRGKQSQKNSYLDDTASSPVLSISKEDEASMEHVMGFKEKSTLKKHFGFLKTSIPGKAASEKSGGFQGRKWQ